MIARRVSPGSGNLLLRRAWTRSETPLGHLKDTSGTPLGYPQEGDEGGFWAGSRVPDQKPDSPGSTVYIPVQNTRMHLNHTKKGPVMVSFRHFCPLSSVIPSLSDQKPHETGRKEGIGPESPVSLLDEKAGPEYHPFHCWSRKRAQGGIKDGRAARTGPGVPNFAQE